MTLTHSIESISYPEFKQTLSRYERLIEDLTVVGKGRAEPNQLDTLQQLDEYRLVTVPRLLQSMRDDYREEPCLSRDEVKNLLRWKLYVSSKSRRNHLATATRAHIIGRNYILTTPSNPTDVVIRTTSSAFKTYNEDLPASHTLAIQKLAELKGIGPATASLLLSVYDPTDVPFFSDELFRWAFYEAKGGPEKGWERKIKYDLKEYRELFKKVSTLRERLGSESGKTVRAVDVEKVGFVLGKEVGKGPNGRAKNSTIEGDASLPSKISMEISPPPPAKRRSSKKEMANGMTVAKYSSTSRGTAFSGNAIQTSPRKGDDGGPRRFKRVKPSQ
ncbi:MAG: hypothetical protein M1827_005471 [Pycnora praestabilis]|nr:MAG: hypothetical protein M1827_005471 [Pycnora praestabilis]